MTKGKDDLAGFRDFLDGEKDLRRPSGAGAASKHAGFELLTFLELESSRLDKQLAVMEEKSYILKNCDSFEQLNRQINRDISLKNAQLMKLLYREDSPMMKSLEELFRAVFNS